jgi:biofilm PGA synthesis lipoprotein PgaB
VYAWMPVSAFQLPASDPAADKVVQTMPGAPDEAKDGYHRLSVFDPDARQAIVDIYDDLGRYAAFSGVLYHDDGMFNDYEDASPAALRTYRQWGLPADVSGIRADPKLAARWMQDKTQYLIAFTNQLTATLRRWQPTLLTARNMYAGPLLDPSSEAWFAQNYAAFLKNYDFTAIEAMPYMENAAKPDDWLADLARRAAQIPGALDRTVFELQARDWKTGKPVPDKTLESQFMLLRRLGVRHLGYYPDDFLDDQPGQEMLKRQLSTQTELGNDYLKDPINTPASLGGAGPSSANQKKSGDR